MERVPSTLEFAKKDPGAVALVALVSSPASSLKSLLSPSLLLSDQRLQLVPAFLSPFLCATTALLCSGSVLGRVHHAAPAAEPGTSGWGCSRRLRLSQAGWLWGTGEPLSLQQKENKSCAWVLSLCCVFFFSFFEIRRLILMLGCVPLRWGLPEQLG